MSVSNAPTHPPPPSVEIGLAVQSGGALSSCAPATNPCRQAFVDYEGGPNKSRYSWDPLSTMNEVIR